jgi:hypothetical protein
MTTFCDCPRKSERVDAPSAGAWTRVTVETDFRNATVFYDGRVAHSSAFGGFVPSTATVHLGIASLFVNPAMDARFDAFVCEALP